MPELENLYLRLPAPLQQLACSVEGWRVKHTRYDHTFFEILKIAEGRTYWPVEQLIEFRDRRLAEFVRHCATTVPYYRRRFRELGISHEDIRCLDDLKLFPLLTKDLVRENFVDLVSEAVPARERLTMHTSGTTGSGLRFATTRRAVQEQWATWWRYRRWHGIDLVDWCGYFGGRSVVPLSQSTPPFWRYNYPMHQILFSGYHMSDSAMPTYLTELRRSKPAWLFGYPSLFSLLAAHAIETHIDLGYLPKQIMVGSENLLPQQSDLITRAFGIRPVQHYGMTEGAANFSQCELGRLHVDEDFAGVEFVPDESGFGNRVVGTNFSNPAFPLLRYIVQDRATLSNESCSCGRAGRIVSDVDGRMEDYVVLRNGAKIGRMDHVFKDMIRIKEAQIFQQVPGEITVRVVRARDYTSDDERNLLGEIHKRVGDDTAVIIDYEEPLQRSRTGKLRFVVSTVGQPLDNGEKEFHEQA
jgi:phenylacetate-CoA ligase